MAGAQEKTAFLKLDGKWHLPLGATPTSHIFKLPIGHIDHSGMDLSDSVENEWLCHALLRAFGVPVANAEMFSFDGTKALVVERFDRRWSDDGAWLMRLPQEDMCQALNTSAALKYESDGGPGIAPIMELLLGSVRSIEDRIEFMTRVFLFWIMGAIDGHAKNFSIFLLPQGAYHLTPAYDVMSAYPLLDKNQLHRRDLRMAMALTGENRHYEWDFIQSRHWFSTSGKINFPHDEMKGIMERVCDQMENAIAAVQNALPEFFPEQIAESVFRGMVQARERVRSRVTDRVTGRV